MSSGASSFSLIHKNRTISQRQKCDTMIGGAPSFTYQKIHISYKIPWSPRHTQTNRNTRHERRQPGARPNPKFFSRTAHPGGTNIFQSRIFCHSLGAFHDECFWGLTSTAPPGHSWSEYRYLSSLVNQNSTLFLEVSTVQPSVSPLWRAPDIPPHVWICYLYLFGLPCVLYSRVWENRCWCFTLTGPSFCFLYNCEIGLRVRHSKHGRLWKTLQELFLQCRFKSSSNLAFESEKHRMLRNWQRDDGSA